MSSSRLRVAVALALTPAGGDGLASRLPTYLHPIAGRPLAWHTLRALGTLAPPPERIALVGAAEVSAELFRDLPVALEIVEPDALDALLRSVADEELLVVDAAAAVPGERLGEIAATSGPRLLVDGAGALVAARLFPDQLSTLVREGERFAALAAAVAPGEQVRDPSAVVVHDRAGLARATAAVRDRLVRVHMAAGVTFLLPDSVLVDVDVRMGRDGIVYPGVVLEGTTEVGEETVIGPGCRLVDAWIGSGVELKGWNYISHTSIRNRAILEPHVRRGFD